MTRKRPRIDLPQNIRRARDLREHQTLAEQMLWNVLRAKRLGGLKFRRQHPIGPFIADFACPANRLVIELDGGYHNDQIDQDRQREVYLKDEGWRVIRFANQDVIDDVDAVARSIAKTLGVEADFRPRPSVRSGMMVKPEREEKRHD